MTSTLSLCKLWTYSRAYGVVSPEWQTTCTPLPSFQPLSLPLICLHPSLALHQCWVILLFYYSPEAAGADAALRSCLVPSAFFPPPSPHFRSPGEKETREEGAGGEGGKLSSQRGLGERQANKDMWWRGEWDTLNFQQKKKKRLDRRDRWIKGLTEERLTYYTSTRDFGLSCGTHLRSKITHSAFAH